MRPGAWQEAQFCAYRFESQGSAKTLTVKKLNKTTNIILTGVSNFETVILMSLSALVSDA
jgi:hypothetical protein